MEPKTITFVCLANSRKKGGRCIAGKKWDNNAPGEWVRPVGGNLAWGLRRNEYRLSDYSLPAVLDILQIPVAGACPLPYQKENLRVDEGCDWERKGRLPLSALAGCLDHPESLWADNHHSSSGLNNRVPAGEADGSSLFLISVPSLSLEVETRKPWLPKQTRIMTKKGRQKEHEQQNVNRRVQGLFLYSGTAYRLTVTDPDIEEEYRQKPDGEYVLENPVLCLSLSDEFEGYYYKLIASVIREA